MPQIDPQADPKNSNDKPSRSVRKSGAVLRNEAFSVEREATLQLRIDPDVPRQSDVAGDVEPFNWQERVNAYRQRQQEMARPQSDTGIEPQHIPEPTFPGLTARNRWIPIGPSAVRKGQAPNLPPISGRISSIVVASGGNRVYVGAANGGVWRSEDKGRTWRSLMEAFDLNPQNLASDSLACGAITLVPGQSADSDIIYVGSGEAIGSPVEGTGTGPYFGVGPIVSNDGGRNWRTERTAPGDPPLNETGFFELAVDPNNAANVLAATPLGLYRRIPDPLNPGLFIWQRVVLTTNTSPTRPIPAVTSVVAAVNRRGRTVFCAANVKGGIFKSRDGIQWNVLASDETTTAHRRVLAMRPNNPNYLYIMSGSGIVAHVKRLRIRGNDFSQEAIADFLGNFAGSSPNWGRAMAVKPDNEGCVFLGGMLEYSDDQGNIVGTDQPGNWAGGLYRTETRYLISGSPAGGTTTRTEITDTYIGGSVHPDIHALAFNPDNADELWLGCDGGLFFTDRPMGAGMIFDAKNSGLQTLMMHHMGQHPTEDGVLFCGTQDNGNLRFSGEEAWYLSVFGDCGYAVVNWADPYKVISTIQRDSRDNVMPFAITDNGGVQGTHERTRVWYGADDDALFYFPLVGTEPESGRPNRLASGSRRLWISEDFGETWASIPNGDTSDILNSEIRAIAFHGSNMIYVGSMEGEVYRYTFNGGAWSQERIDVRLVTLPFGAPVVIGLPISGPITDIAVDPAVPNGEAIYVTFGGHGDYRHVWHFDGTDWHSRSGAWFFGADTMLLDVQHNAIVVDPENPQNIYVGADIGVWRSTDRGNTWAPFALGLPDAAVIDLKLHPRRLLRASTHGRSVYEIRLDETWVPAVELFLRDTQLDQGRRRTANGRDNPIRTGARVYHWHGQDIKIDIPDPSGDYHFGPGAVDFVTFEDALVDETYSRNNRLNDVTDARVYIQIHNRGILSADNVRVMALITDTTAGLPPLPTGYDANIRNGIPIENDDWRTIGIETVNGVRAGYPQIVEFTLMPDLTPPPTGAMMEQYSIVVFAHHVEDPYNSTRVGVDANTRRERKAGQKNTAVLRFQYQEPRRAWFPSTSTATLHFRYGNPKGIRFGMQLYMNRYPGRVYLCLPKELFNGPIEGSMKGLALSDKMKQFRAWAEDYIETIETYQRKSKRPFNRQWTKRRIDAVRKAMVADIMLQSTGADVARIDNLALGANGEFTAFLAVEHPEIKGVIAPLNDIEVLITSANGRKVLGGMNIEVVQLPPLRK